MGWEGFKLSAGLIFLLTGANLVGQQPNQFPGLPTRQSGQTGQTGKTGQSQQTPRLPSRQIPPSQRPQHTEPQGTAPRTGIGLGFWDAFIQMEERKEGLDLGAAPDRSLLLRLSDQVWVRAPEEKAPDLVYYWKKTRLLTTGYEIELKNHGRALLAFYDGAVLDCRGNTKWEILRLDREMCRLRFSQVNAILAEARDRPVYLELPGRYVLVAKGCLVQVSLDQNRRLFVANLGPGQLVINDQERQHRVAWNKGCYLPLFRGAPPRALPPLAGPGEKILSLGGGTWQVSWGQGVELKQDRSILRLGTGLTRGRVNWGRCGFDLPPGRTLTLKSFGRVVTGRISEKIRGKARKIGKKP